MYKIHYITNKNILLYSEAKTEKVMMSVVLWENILLVYIVSYIAADFVLYNLHDKIRQ